MMMRTRTGLCYPKNPTLCLRRALGTKRVYLFGAGDQIGYRKRQRRVPAPDKNIDWLEYLPEDLVILILSKLSSSATCPSDLISVSLTCKRLRKLGRHSLVLARASQKCFSVKAKNWSEYAHRFMKLCADTGNIEACYTLGMIRFYCYQNRGGGASLMARAAICSHAPALYSLAVIQFNGSGGSKNDKDLRAGVALCARAAFLGHIDALREIGHCLQDGYGVRQNVAEGRRFLIQANAREVVHFSSGCAFHAWNQPVSGAAYPDLESLNQAAASGSGCPLLSDFGCNVPAPEAHPASQFLTEWFAEWGGPEGEGLSMCSHAGCGRPETRPHEFRRCSVCGTVNYCSRACQALDWKLRHKAECAPPVVRLVGNGEGGDGGALDGNDVPGEFNGNAVVGS